METPSQYINFARKYRPSNFDELLGQEALIKVINYSIINNKLSQSYLLTGIRGVGKTTSARLIAKIINCSNSKVRNDLVFACNECQNCQNFIDQRHPDVIEIDAASQTGVDDIRDVIESSEYRPLIGKYKIFIIDEVHMLSKSAFNALLKVLEEPPPHVIFVFATTEVQKIPTTIISRCQKYDLRRLTHDEVVGLLEKIVAQEGLNFDEQALRLIATKSEGSARDAVRLLDQASNLSSTEVISALSINQMIGSVDTQFIIDLLIYIVQQDGIKAVELVNKAYKLSSNVENFLRDICNFIAYLSKAKIMINYQEPNYIAYSNSVADILIKTNLGQLTILWQIFTQGFPELKSSHNQLISFEMLIIKAMYSYSFPNPESLISIDNEAKNTMSAAVSQPEESSTPPAKAQVDPDIPKIADELVSQDAGIINFLDFLHKNNNMEIYYLLLNCAEIKNFENKKIELISESIDNRLKEAIRDSLLKWTGVEWNVIIAKQPEQVTLKEKLLNQVHSGKDWDIIKKHFPSAKISDLLLNN